MLKFDILMFLFLIYFFFNIFRFLLFLVMLGIFFIYIRFEIVFGVKNFKVLLVIFFCSFVDYSSYLMVLYFNEF